VLRFSKPVGQIVKHNWTARHRCPSVVTALQESQSAVHRLRRSTAWMWTERICKVAVKFKSSNECRSAMASLESQSTSVQTSWQEGKGWNWRRPRRATHSLRSRWTPSPTSSLGPWSTDYRREPRALARSRYSKTMQHIEFRPVGVSSSASPVSPHPASRRSPRSSSTEPTGFSPPRTREPHRPH
jgi:hypothetical protein